MALHEQCVGATDEWYTPRHVFEAMAVQFDMDVASPGKDVVPWIPAMRHMTENSLTKPWSGFVWMNAPFGPRNGLVPWVKKFFEHGCGVALVPDRTSAPWWQQFVPAADLVLFVSPKIKFVGADRKSGKSPAQGTCLLAAGKLGVGALRNAADNGLGVLMTPSRCASAGVFVSQG
jgi:DNA N-6-adenine-methyltransferase (Dam)